MNTTRKTLGQCNVAAGAQALADEFREVASEHQVALAQSCDSCNTVLFPPMLGCPACASDRLSWIDCGVRAKVGTFVAVHTAEATPSMGIPGRLRDKVPYASVFAIPDDYPAIRLAALVIGDDVAKVQIGAAVTLDATSLPLIASLVAG